LIGPLLIAANNRKTYEITMGATMIGACTSLPFFLGTVVGMVLILLGYALKLQIL